MEIHAAPLQGLTETPWRNAHNRVFGGIDAYYTPFIRWEKEGVRNKDKRETNPGMNAVSCLVPQVLASDPEELERLVSFLQSQGYREVNVNMGCPFPPVANRGRGSGLLAFPEKVRTLLDAMSKMPEVRFSVKMRLGWKESGEWKLILPLLNDSCVRQVILHPRVGKQQYHGETDMMAFSAFYEECRLPLIYNGDLHSVEDMFRMAERYLRLKGVMLGRGLLADPSLARAFRAGSAVSGKELYSQVFEMHRLIFEEYSSRLEGGEAQLLRKLQAFWEYLLPSLDKRVRKSLLKATCLDRYLLAVEKGLLGA